MGRYGVKPELMENPLSLVTLLLLLAGPSAAAEPTIGNRSLRNEPDVTGTNVSYVQCLLKGGVTRTFRNIANSKTWLEYNGSDLLFTWTEDARDVGSVYLSDATGDTRRLLDLQAQKVTVTGADDGPLCSITAAAAAAPSDGGSHHVANSSSSDRRMAPFGWSSDGPIDGTSCVQILESADPHTWSDNYFCSPYDIGMRWSSAGVIPGMTCVQTLETADPHTWADNYLCLPPTSPYRFLWSSAGPNETKTCIQWIESADPHTWNDNYLCW